MTYDDFQSFDVICKDRECARCRAVQSEPAEASHFPPDIAALSSYRARSPRTTTPVR